MGIEGQPAGTQGPQRVHWPAQRTSPRAASTSLYVYVLDADSELAEEFDVHTRAAARQVATAKVFQAPVGACDLEPWWRAVGAGPGLLILEGIIAFETRIGDRTAMELVGAGDLLQMAIQRPEDLLERSDSWRVLRSARLALLDGDFAERIQPWPRLINALLRRSGSRIAEIDALRAITSQPRLEIRIVLLLWHLSARWGRVEPSGIHLTLPLTHRLLGELAGAERPSISHALARLSHARLVTGAADDLHLHGTLEQHLEALLGRTATAVARRSSA
jgi:CRP/FNR family transcriptional regulator, cyclic AMP receptor protein